MTGPRRANWRTEMDAVVDAHRDLVAEWLQTESDARARQVVEMRDRIEKLERRRSALVYGFAALAALVSALAVWAVMR